MSTNQTQIIHDMSNADYHALPSISKSGLDLIRRAPALYKWSRDNRTEQTPAMRWGTLVHTAILEPDTVAERMIVAPSIDRRSNAGKAEFAEFQLVAKGRDIITAEEQEALAAVRDSVWTHPATSKALGMLRDVEASIFWTDETSGVECRCRPDGIMSNGTILDVKTTVDASADSFAKSIANYRYHVQAAFYGDGYKAAFGDAPRAFVFLAVEKTAPYLCALYVMDAKAVIRGRSEYQTDLETYRSCRNTDEWPGLASSPTVIDLPKWA